MYKPKPQLIQYLLKDELDFVPVAIEDNSRLSSVAYVFQCRAKVIHQLAIVFQAPYANHGVIRTTGRCS